MTNFLYAEINIVGIVVLLLFLLNVNKNSHKKKHVDQYIFDICIIMNIVIFLLDTGMWLLDGNHFWLGGARIANYIVTALYYASNPLICFFWLLYTDFKIHESRRGLLRRVRFYVIPCAINMVLSFASIFTGWLFVIDKNNNYMRGPYFWIMALCSLFYLLFACGISFLEVYKNGWEENKKVYIHLAIYPIGVITASVIQIMHFGVSIIWVCSMLAFASMYINIQNGEISTDHLTGLYNRRRLDVHLLRRLKQQKKEHQLFAIMLDLDDFKNINDKYGHAAGDKALVGMADLLRSACRDSDDFIARMGGDEFLIVGERASTEEIVQLMEEIALGAKRYNKECQSQCFILPSMGYAVLKKGDTIDSFLAAADQAMYQNKQEHRVERRR